MKSTKYASIKIGKCPKCKYVSKQYLVNYSYSIYKCSKCNTIHTLK